MVCYLPSHYPILAYIKSLDIKLTDSIGGLSIYLVQGMTEATM